MFTKVHSKQVSFQGSEDSTEGLYQKIESRELSVAGLNQGEAFELIQWVIINRPASELLSELYQRDFTLTQQGVIRRLEDSYQTPLRPEQLPYEYPRSPSPSPIDLGNVRRRLFFDEDDEEEKNKPDCSMFKFALVLAGTYVIYRVVVKPIFNQIGEFFKWDVGDKSSRVL